MHVSQLILFIICLILAALFILSGIDLIRKIKARDPRAMSMFPKPLLGEVGMIASGVVLAAVALWAFLSCLHCDSDHDDYHF